MPVAELFFVNLDIQFHDPTLQSYLNIAYGLVVYARPNFFEEELEQGVRCHVSDFLFHVLAEIAFDGCDRSLASFFAEFDGHVIAVSSRKMFGVGASTNRRVF